MNRTLRIFRPALFSLLATVAVAAPATAQDPEPPAADLTGAWVLTVESPNGTGTRDVEFAQDGNELTGTIASTMAVGDLAGTIEGAAVRFVAVVAMDTGDFQITYQATVKDGALVEGTVDFGDYGSGTFTGRRKESGASAP